MRNVQPSQVTLFLVQFKEFAQNKFTFAESDKSRDAITHLGISFQQAKQEILGLTYEDYYRGPITDTEPKGGEYWEFGKIICGQEIFIKLKTVSKYRVAVCFSFHIPEEKIEYPYKRRKEKK